MTSPVRFLCLISCLTNLVRTQHAAPLQLRLLSCVSHIVNVRVVPGIISLALLIITLHPAAAQSGNLWQVFLERDVNETGIDHIIFVDVVTGEESSLRVFGERYTPINDAIMFLDTHTDRVMLATPDGEINAHPFIQPSTAARRIDWLISDDSVEIVWTITEGGAQIGLTTTTFIANLDGSDARQVFTDGPRNGVRALPVAFSADQTTLYMDYQPDGLSEYTAFDQYAGLFALDLATGDVTMLPGEPGCFCGAGFGAGFLLRLALSADGNSFDLRVHNIAGEAETTIPALHLSNYTQSGAIIVNSDGTSAVYALSQIEDFGTPEQSVQTVFMLVDLINMTQSPLTEPITTFVHPLTWTENDNAILFTSPQIDGTWKINLDGGRLTQVAEVAYLGTLRR